MWDPFDARPDLFGGRYRTKALLGSGGAGAVYQALDEKTRRQVALKLVEAPALKVPVRFLAEARDMARLKHPRVVRVFDVGHDDHWYWFVMELMTGGSLRDWVGTNGPMAPDLALYQIYEVLRGLNALHAAGLVHRDVKPHNLLLNHAGMPTIADLGLARHEAGDVPWRTRTGESLGTPGYQAPEQATQPSTAGREADVYATGGVLFFLVTGRRPSHVYMQTDEEFEGEANGMPASVVTVVRRAMAYQSEARYRTAVEMASAVATAYDALPERAQKPPVAARWMREFELIEEPGFWQRLVGWLRGR